MADNVTYQTTVATPPNATVVATDQLATGEHVQYVKLMDGTLDGTTKAAVGANGLAADVKASVLPTGAATSAAQTDGTQKAIARGGAKGTTAAADITSTAQGANNQAVDVQIYHGGVAKDPTAIRALTTADAVNVGQWVGSAAPTVGQKLMASSLPVAIASDQPALAAPTLTKGTQGATGYSVQDLKDSGRVNIMWTAEFAFAQVAETLLTVTESRDGATATTFSSKVVTSGKRIRITSVALEAESLGTGTTPQRCYLRMRFNTAGAVVATSPLQGVWGLGVTTAIVKASEKESWSFPDGVEYLGDGTKQIGFTLETPDFVATTGTGRAKITITAFEY